MREFTKEEKERIINIPITMDCFDSPPKSCLEGILGLNYERGLKNTIERCEDLRVRCKRAKSKLDKEILFRLLVGNLPYNSYKVVKL